MYIPVFKPYINRKDMDSVLSCLVSEKLENNQISKQLCSDICKAIEADDGFLFKEYRRAIEIVLQSIDAESKKYVILSPLLPVYYKFAIEEAGLIPLYVDVNPGTASVSYDKLSETVHNNQNSIHSIIVDSPLGYMPEFAKIAELGVTLIEDISNSFGASVEEKKSGSFGDYIIMNMDPDKIVTAGTGTFVAVKSKKNRELFRNRVLEYEKDIFLPDLNAALAMHQVNNLEKIINARNDLAVIYSQAVMKTKNKTFAQTNNSCNAFTAFPVIAEGSTKEIKKYALKKGVEVLDAFSDSIISKANIEECPEAKALNMRCLIFPLYPNIGKNNAEKIVKIISTLP
ncbi:MAG: DegT/DnrJ/EryC1/StrS family aminotransferase [Spirochaetes bacterium]|nr:DegT/DnrJ/EryC1/StrS family aminotransferase [Spirochaetota bacterium]